ncbi:MAG TPA: hypothetical protein PLR25_20615 [Planctomycetaceae bacterium]|nr:hypothetical protein [Planctomycetaceae bacterium]
MRLIVALSTVAMIGLSSTAMGFETSPSLIPAGDVTQSLQSLEVRQSAKVNHTEVVARSGGFFGRLMDVERRKNAWFRRTFTR